MYVVWVVATSSRRNLPTKLKLVEDGKSHKDAQSLLSHIVGSALESQKTPKTQEGNLNTVCYKLTLQATVLNWSKKIHCLCKDKM